MRLQNDVGRSCGPCNACCKVFTIPEVEKNDFDWCHHCTRGENGCGIYESRPQECRDFVCLWRNGAGSEGHRPDESGFLMDLRSIRIGRREVAVLYIWELERGALITPYVEKSIERSLEAGRIVVCFRILTEKTSTTHIHMSRAHFAPEAAESARRQLLEAR